MTTTRGPDLLPDEIVTSLELVMFGAIGMTSVALGRVAASDLTLPQWRALVVIGQEDRNRVGDIAARIGLSVPSASRLIRRLERRGYVFTERDESDRRATLVRLTPEGETVRAAVIAHRRELMNEALAGYAHRLPRDLTRGLQTIARAFDRYE